MATRILAHVRSNLVGYTALFVALTGTAWAVAPLAGRNTVNSAAIINGQVKRVDLAANAVAGGKVADGGLTAADLAPGSVGASEVADGSLTGAEIDEAALGQVPVATLGGLGRSAAQGGSICDPENAVGFSTCASTSLTLQKSARVLVLARVKAEVEVGADSGNGQCRLVGNGILAAVDSVTVRVVKVVGGPDINLPVTGAVPFMAVTTPLGPGQVSFSVECNQVAPGAIVYRSGAIAAVALSPS
jgi:hypothetical protein